LVNSQLQQQQQQQQQQMLLLPGCQDGRYLAQAVLLSSLPL
jgi:hypothetical protein